MGRTSLSLLTPAAEALAPRGADQRLLRAQTRIAIGSPRTQPFLVFVFWTVSWPRPLRICHLRMTIVTGTLHGGCRELHSAAVGRLVEDPCVNGRGVFGEAGFCSAAEIVVGALTVVAPPYLIEDRLRVGGGVHLVQVVEEGQLVNLLALRPVVHPQL